LGTICGCIRAGGVAGSGDPAYIHDVPVGSQM
jgi:hypothetical protein